MPFLLGIYLIVFIKLGLVSVDVELPDRDDTLAAYQEVQLDPVMRRAGMIWLCVSPYGELVRAERHIVRCWPWLKRIRIKKSGQWLSAIWVFYRPRGELDKAEEMHQKSLELYQALGSKEGLAANYGNLGLVYRTRGELERPRRCTESLELDQALGSKQGMAKDYGNLGSVYLTRGEL